MPISMYPRFPSFAQAFGLALACASIPLALHAEKADRTKPMVVESDGKQAASVDLNRKITVISGNVSIVQGSLQIKADRVEVHELESGQFTAIAKGSAAQPATFRQKRDRVDEFIEGRAEHVDYDGAQETVKLVGNAQLKVLRAGAATDEASAETIVYNQRADTIVFEGASAVSPGLTSSKARLVFVPRAQPEPSAAPASAPDALRPAAPGKAR
jgi:lipopolysaccharide export system protein LptA